MQYYMQFGKRVRLYCNHLKSQQSISFQVYQAKYWFFFFKEYKKHFLRLRIRGLVVRLQQESTFENSKRLIIDWANKLVQSKIILNQDQICYIGKFPLFDFGYFRTFKGKQIWVAGSFCSRTWLSRQPPFTHSVCDSTKAVRNGASAWDF